MEKLLEKHITLNKKLDGADHKISLNPLEFKKMVEKIRRVEKLLGSEKISPTKEEINKKIHTQRYIFSKIKITKGKKINLNNVVFKRSNLKKKQYFKSPNV